MTDYKLINENTKKSQDREETFTRKKSHIINETKQGIVSKDQESDDLVVQHRDITKDLRPGLVAKDPSTFAFFASAKKCYKDAFYNIINYYPYDGTRYEILKWFSEARFIDVSILQNHWPSNVGNINLNKSEAVTFYAGPQSIPESDFTGNYRDGESGLKFSPAKGNTVEFWLKKDSFTTDTEVVFDIGSYPGKVTAAQTAMFRLSLSGSSDKPFFVDYLSGSHGANNKSLGSDSITKDFVGDGNWHHYAITACADNDSALLDLIFYVDGAEDSRSQVEISSMGDIDTYMAGAIGAEQAQEGTLDAAIDDFRFWKGKRSTRNIGRFFDEKIYASSYIATNEENSYNDRLGLYYRFNKATVGNTLKDKLVLDYSGNDITGVIKNYIPAVKVANSAITLSTVSPNSETPDYSLDFEDPEVSKKQAEFLKIGESYDLNNPSNIKNFVPEWVYDANNNGLSNEDSQISILFNLLAGELDDARTYLNVALSQRKPEYEEASYRITDSEPIVEENNSSEGTYFLGCDDEEEFFAETLGYHSSIAESKLQAYGIRVEQKPLIDATINQELDSKIEDISITKPIEEIRRAILENVYSAATHYIKRKGSEKSIDPILHSYGIDRDLLSYNVYGVNSEIFIGNEKLDYVSEEKNSVYFGQNIESTIFLSASRANERTYLQSDSQETQYTFEGTFIFPTRIDLDHKIKNSSVFGLAQVSPSNNNHTFTSTNNADFRVEIEKLGKSSDDAKFILKSDTGIISNLESPVFKNVYDNSRWNIALRFSKDVDNRFISSSSPSYKVELLGHNYTLDVLNNHFTVSATLTQAKYESFRLANKTIFIGAQRENITGSVITNSDIKVINFGGWNDSLTEEEIRFKAQSPSVEGRHKPFAFKDNCEPLSKKMNENKIFAFDFDNVIAVNSENKIVVEDFTSGSVNHALKYGNLIGNKYPAASTSFAVSTDNVVQREFLPVVRNVPIPNVHGTEGVSVKTSEINKFDLASRPEGKLFSFEKSMYQAISREMIKFIGGLKSFNNLIGEPVYKYRKNYKMLEHLRMQFFETVENEDQFERFVSYFRWIDSSIGKFLQQIIPATANSNTGIENVVESHALERNKYDHKAPFVKQKDHTGGIEANLLAINELLYDWEHGHFSEDEDEHCLWQKDRKERTGDREKLRKVFTTVVSGSTYVRRNLVKPYKYTVDRQHVLTLGSNRNANKIKNLYKIVNNGKEITIDSEDIYQFKKCDDVLEPQKKRIYTAKTNTSETNDYLDADADLILPFSFYSSSVGTDFENFKQDLKITNNHDDVPALQSSFVKQFVGGLPHRNVKFGTADKDRPEAYDISASATTLTVKQTTAPKSMFHRDLGGARFYHIGNVKTTQSPLVLGNYSKDYEIVMTNARSYNNNYLVENEGFNLTGGIQISNFVPEAVEFPVPERPARDHVIVNRFAAPGGAETSTPQSMDRESSEFSVYNTVNYRNPVVRNIENLLLKEVSDQFGYRSGSATQGSKHKTNRNKIRATGSFGEEFTNNNAFVSREIPSHDFGYAFITAAANESVYSFLNKNENTSHQHLFNISGALKSSETISFVSASELVENLDFVGLNTLTTRNVISETNTLTNSGATLNTILLNRQGPSGHPSWKQIRGQENPVIRLQRRENKLSVVYREENGQKHAFVDSIKDRYKFDLKDIVVDSSTITAERKIKNYDEMFVTSRFNPLNANLTSVPGSLIFENLDTLIIDGVDVMGQSAHHVMWKNDEHYLSAVARNIEETRSGLTAGDDPFFINDETDSAENAILTSLFISGQLSAELINSPTVSMQASVQNKITGFAQRKLEELTFSSRNIHSTIWSNYVDEDKFKSEPNLSIIKGTLQLAAIQGLFRELNYKEAIYPREINTYKENSRQRKLFDFFGWNSVRSNRNLILRGNVSYPSALIDLTANDVNLILFYQPKAQSQENSFNKAYFDNVEIVDVNSTGSDSSIEMSTHITGSKWVLDSRQDFASKPINITASYFTQGDQFLRSRSQGTRGEGILQNDFSIFPLGYNALKGAPPIAPVYNRRIPQAYGEDVYLSGEAKWEAAKERLGPFYDSYEEYSKKMKQLGQSYSLVPEFKITNVSEDYISNPEGNNLIKEDFLEVTGAVYHTSSGDISVGSQFFESYSMSDFMKYFEVLNEDIQFENLGLQAGKITLRCQAVKRFLPYRGFYPAERVVQLSEIFNRQYLKQGTFNQVYIENSAISKPNAESFLELRLENSKAQALKPIMAPGVLLNSIKTGLAVDYPIFSSSVDSAINYLFKNQFKSGSQEFSPFQLGSSTSFTGSEINNTTDEGIPRIKGPVENRITFEDLLAPSRLYSKVIYDNEPHPSASLLYGTDEHLKVLERPVTFGSLDAEETQRFISIKPTNTRTQLGKQLAPFKVAVNNFCSETVNFFLEDGKLQTAISSPNPAHFESGQVYKMRVYIANENTVMYDRHSAFGPPVDEGDVEITRPVITDTTVQAAKASFNVDIGGPLLDHQLFANSEVTASNFAIQTASSQLSNLGNVDPANEIIEAQRFWVPVGRAPKMSGFQYRTPAPNNTAQDVYFYDPDTLFSGRTVLDFQGGNVSTAQRLLFEDEIEGSPRLEFHITNGTNIIDSYRFLFYDSETTGGVLPSDISGSGATSTLARVDLSEIGAPFSKAPAVMAQDISGTLANHFLTGAYANQILIGHDLNNHKSMLSFVTQRFKPAGAANAQFPFLIVSGNINSIIAQAGGANRQDHLTQAVGIFDVYGTATKSLIKISTGSAGSADVLVSEPGPLSCVHKFFPDTVPIYSNYAQANRNNKSIIGLLTASLGQSTARYVSVRTLPTDLQLGVSGNLGFYNPTPYTVNGSVSGLSSANIDQNVALDLADRIFDMSGAENITASVASSVTTVESTVTGLNTSAVITTGMTNSNHETFSLNSTIATVDNAFAGGADFVEGSLEFVPTTAIESSSHGYLPFVAPFLDPNTSPYAELSFTPSRDGEHAIPEILDNLVISYYNMPAPSNPSSNTNYIEAMVLSASVNFKKFVKLSSDHFIEGAQGKVGVDSTTSNLYRWVIQPKWETPIINFANVTASALDLSSNSVSEVSGSPWKFRFQSDYYQIDEISQTPYLTASTGMWHQSGAVLKPSDKEGYYMILEAGGISKNSTDQDLASKVGFFERHKNRKEYKLGKLAESKEVCEAVVAIPFYHNPKQGLKFFDIHDDVYNSAIVKNKSRKEEFTRSMTLETDEILKQKLKKSYERFYNLPGTDGVDNVAYQLRMMEKFVLPPQFDFTLSDLLDCANKKPFVQYIFQFKTQFTRDDLASMWQNLYPNSESSAACLKHSSVYKGDVEYVSNYLFSKQIEMFTNKFSNYESVEEFIENEVRWLVFKVKQKATKDYQLIINKSISDIDRNLIEIDGQNVTTSFPKSIEKIGSNWPYDYFSLVELGKLESKVDFYDDRNLTRSKKQGVSTSTSQQSPPKPGSSFEENQSNLPASSTSGTSTTAVGVTGASIASVMAIREVLLSDTDSISGRSFTATQGAITPGTEQLFLNGILQKPGADNDYVISGNTVTFTYDLVPGDNLQISFIKG